MFVIDRPIGAYIEPDLSLHFRNAEFHPPRYQVMATPVRSCRPSTAAMLALWLPAHRVTFITATQYFYFSEYQSYKV